MDELTKEFIAESHDGLERMELCLTELEKHPGNGELVSEIFRTVHTIKGTTGFLGFTRLQALAHAGESLLGALRDGKIDVTTELIEGLLHLMDGLRQILRLIEATGIEGALSTDDDQELIGLLTRLRSGGAESLAARAPASRERDGSTNSGQSVGNPASWAGSAPLADQRTLRIDVDVLNRMMNLVGELVLTRNQIVQSVPGAEGFTELARRLDGVTSELRESVMQARLQPVGHLFGKFPRMVRDLARTCERQVRIEFEGQETGLDKSLLEAIRDPLTHAVRNSVGHGIEPAEVRMKAGKPAEGVVRLRAYHEGGSVAIEVTDDGAGIPAAAILKKAIERGLMTPELAAQMTEREALQLIFVAGISLSPTVTHISGRGVGMDVVRANVEKVGGSVQVESRVGVGTTVRLLVPLTLAIVPALVVRSGEQSFALPQSSVVELVYVARRESELAVERVGSAELYRLREGLLPLVWLDRLLGLERCAAAEARGFYIAVIESEGRRFGLVVDDLKAPEEIVVKPLSAVLRDIGLFSGATVLGNGTLAMILDVAAAGARAGVSTTSEAGQAKACDSQAATPACAEVEHAQVDMESSMVIYETWKRGSEQDGRRARMAMPLNAVERIERVPLNTIEFAGGGAVLQYEGELLALEDDGEILLETGPANGMATVLICRRPGPEPARRVGVVVRSVLDVSAGKLLPADASACAGLAMVKNRVTTLHGELAGWVGGSAIGLLQEVA